MEIRIHGRGGQGVVTMGELIAAAAYIDGKEPSGLYGFRTNATGLLPNCGSPTFHLSNAHNGRRQ